MYTLQTLQSQQYLELNSKSFIRIFSIPTLKKSGLWKIVLENGHLRKIGKCISKENPITSVLSQLVRYLLLQNVIFVIVIKLLSFSNLIPEERN